MHSDPDLKEEFGGYGEGQALADKFLPHEFAFVLIAAPAAHVDLADRLCPRLFRCAFTGGLEILIGDANRHINWPRLTAMAFSARRSMVSIGSYCRRAIGECGDRGSARAPVISTFVAKGLRRRNHRRLDRRRAMTNLERDELVASLRDWFKGRGLAGGEAIGIMVLAIAAVTREFDDPEVLVDAAIRGLRRGAADTTPASH
jgi:hypothetical protein